MEENQALFSLTIDPGTKAYLNETAKWAKFLSIVAMIVLILVFLFTVLSASVLDNSTLITLGGASAKFSEGATNSVRIGMIIGSLIMIGIGFIPLFYLLQFANRMKKALAANQQNTLNESFYNLKRYFKFLGIVVIIVLILYACIFAITLLTNNSMRY
jgi:hypothetical protein